MKRIAIIAGAMVAAFSATAHAQGVAEGNIKTMIDAARTLDFVLPENRAFLLVKRETIRSPVAVIFGYVDNEAACEQIAAILSESLRVGTFECDAIY